MHKKDLDIGKIIDNYLANKFSKQDFIDLMDSISNEEEMSEFHRKLADEWEQKINKKDEIDGQERVNLHFEAARIISNSERNRSQVVPQFRLKARRITRYVASITLIIAATASMYLLMNKRNEQLSPKMCNIIIPAGEKKEIKLPDNSDIYINSASSLKYPQIFDEKQRVVELAGEAFFKVTPNKEKPFIINTGQISIKVLGTSFNVRSYDEDEWIGVTVSTGKVSVSIFDENSSIQLIPSEELWINKKNHYFQKSKKDMLQASSWRDGYLYFDKAPIKDVINTLNRKYAVNIKLERPYEEYSITGEHDNKSLQSVLESICFITKLKYKKNGNNITLY